MLRTAFAAALLVALVAAPGRAQNCSNTSVGLTPLADLGAGTYQGFAGGLYPDSSNARPLLHEIGGLAMAAQVVPRNAQGAPDPAGRIVVMSLGMSNAAIHWNAFQQLVGADPLRNSKLKLFQGAQGGVPVEEMDEPTDVYWTTTLPQKLAQAGIASQEVQVVWFLQANSHPTAPFPQHAQNLQEQMASCLRILEDFCPNVRIAYVANRIYAGYATTQLNPEPYAYEQGFALKWLVEQQISGDPTLNYDADLGPVEAPWLAWGPYTWADGTTPSGSGLTWICSDFQSDGTHPSPQGAQKNMQRFLAFVHTDTTARSWYLAQPAPVAYATGKTTSIGSLPAMGWAGTPSAAANDFRITLQGALPSVVAVAYRGPEPAALPFLGGTLVVEPPLVRLPPVMTSPAGTTQVPIPVTSGLIGQCDHFGFWFRDPGHPDGTGVGLSNGLQVRFRP
jgi:hypothetical protein